MIIFKDDEITAIDPNDNITKLDGIYYGVINCVTTTDTDLDNKAFQYYCSLYIPDVHGEIDLQSFNYPVVKIPRYQDDDDIGSEPQIGDICKVMFEDGNSSSCQLIYKLNLAPEYRNLNMLYVTQGIISSSILDRPDNTDEIEQIYGGDLLNNAYYITTGHYKDNITESDFTTYALNGKVHENSENILGAENKSNANCYFCNPLSMPLFAFFISPLTTTNDVPINSSENYNVKNCIMSLNSINNTDTANFIDDIRELYTNSDYDFQYPQIKSPYAIYNTLKTKNIENLDMYMYYALSSSICFCPPQYANMLYPEFSKYDSDLKYEFSVQQANNTDSYDKILWGIFNSSSNSDKKYYQYFSKLLFKYKKYYEDEWIKMVQTYLSGINNIVTTQNNIKLKYTIILCLTICPLLAYPMLGNYFSFNDRLDSDIARYFNFTSDTDKIRIYSTYLNSEEEFNDIRVKLNNIIKDNDKSPENFVIEFKNIAKSVFNSWIADSMGNKYYLWEASKMEDKFNRLQDILPNYLNSLV